jgi:holin-like protein
MSLAFAALAFLLAHLDANLNAAPVGFVLLLAALLSGRFPVSFVEHGAKWLLANSAIFLIPAVVAVSRATHVLEANWLPLTVIIVGGTVLSTALTALVVEFMCAFIARPAPIEAVNE